MSHNQLDLALGINADEPEYICYLAMHTEKNKMYIGITSRDFDTRIAEHLSHAKNGSDNTYFHQEIRREGSEKFEWMILAKGLKDIIKMLEKTLIANLATLKPDGYNSVNESDHLINATKEELEFFESMNSRIQVMRDCYDLNEILDKTKDNPHLSSAAKEKIKELIICLDNK